MGGGKVGDLHLLASHIPDEMTRDIQEFSLHDHAVAAARRKKSRHGAGVASEGCPTRVSSRGWDGGRGPIREATGPFTLAAVPGRGSSPPANQPGALLWGRKRFAHTQELPGRGLPRTRTAAEQAGPRGSTGARSARAWCSAPPARRCDSL